MTLEKTLEVARRHFSEKIVKLSNRFSLDLVIVGKFCFYQSRLQQHTVVDFIGFNPSAYIARNPCLA